MDVLVMGVGLAVALILMDEELAVSVDEESNGEVPDQSGIMRLMVVPLLLESVVVDGTEAELDGIDAGAEVLALIDAESEMVADGIALEMLVLPYRI